MRPKRKNPARKITIVLELAQYRAAEDYGRTLGLGAGPAVRALFLAGLRMLPGKASTSRARRPPVGELGAEEPAGA